MGKPSIFKTSLLHIYVYVALKHLEFSFEAYGILYSILADF